MATDVVTGKKAKKALAYSPTTDKVYYVDGRGEKTDHTDGFYYVLGAMADNNDKGFTLDYKNAGFKLYVLKTPIEEDEAVVTFTKREAQLVFRWLRQAEDRWYSTGDEWNLPNDAEECASAYEKLEKASGYDMDDMETW